MSWKDELDEVRDDRDPLRRVRRAAELSDVYRQRQHELARLRRVAIDEARAQGLSYTEIAAASGVSKGRITQIRNTAPPAERAFFGIGPVAVGVPLRSGEDDRKRTYIDAADANAQRTVESLLAELSLQPTAHSIMPDRTTPFEGDAVVICGPKSAPVGAALLARDPHLDMSKSNGRWWIVERETGTRHGSPRNDPTPTNSDLGYLARHLIDGRVVIHIAGITAHGSLGVIHYLAHNLPTLWPTTGDTQFSLTIRCDHTEDATITSSAAVIGPTPW
ncbi:hypothetical protein [Actinokineospora globicatena]|uniref:hypothetical protein n=1 Tax=Actinokineospora globicatena TaxID=103729 RepID=UPI0020A5D9C3|nr:hypothetical protein [Actinokineospora globicatena]MCP2302154.1 hypothetical protein [Actinokineospora globicatena]GLW76185.1 hypothetical protein Aglo01_06670 [Actinokineospora globicatena]GLW83021.1 hypothetical protein Aglo02_06610 [Actinokineospora globicatena]